MSREMEDRLRAAYQAKADQVTDRRLAQLRAERTSQLAELFSEDVPIARLEHPPVQLDSRRHRHSRWFAPAVAAAAVAAVAAAAFALSTPGLAPDHPGPAGQPHQQPDRVGQPVGHRLAVRPPPARPAVLRRLPAGRPDRRPGRRALVQGRHRLATAAAHRRHRLMATLYLYDPAGGRYLISDQLPARAQLQAWSPDGQRAMLMADGDYTSTNRSTCTPVSVTAGIPASTVPS